MIEIVDRKSSSPPNQESPKPLPPELTKYQLQIRSVEPSTPTNKSSVVIRGAGTGLITAFTDLFDEEYPVILQGKISYDEFKRTIGNINGIICPNPDSNNGEVLCCLCTCGLSACIRSWKVKRKLTQYLAHENKGVYKRLGVEWKLLRSTSPNTLFKEWVLMIKFLPRSCIFTPD